MFFSFLLLFVKNEWNAIVQHILSHWSEEFSTFPWTFLSTLLTSRSREDIRSVSEPHEVKLVKPPVFLIRCLHWVSLPFVHNLISWVAVWKPHGEFGVNERIWKGEKGRNKSWNKEYRKDCCNNAVFILCLNYICYIQPVFVSSWVDCRPTEQLVSLKSIMYNHSEQILLNYLL